MYKFLLFLYVAVLAFLIFTCCTPVMQMRKAVVGQKGNLVPVENWQKYQLKKGDTITVITKR